MIMIKRIAFTCFFSILLFLSQSAIYAQNRVFDYSSNEFKDTIVSVVTRYISHYPQSNLSDIYKFFFQDKFGPEHLVSDTASVGVYLRNELASYSLCDFNNTSVSNNYNVIGGSSYMEITGYEGNYVRIDLAVVKEGIVNYKQYRDAFIQSAKSSPKVDITAWRTEWNAIESIIKTMNLNFENYNKDKTEIESMLARGEYVGHHSRKFIKMYRPHYRLFSKEEACIISKIIECHNN